MKITAAGKSWKGSRRESYDDRYLVRSFSGEQILIVVADGMGGHEGGNIAAEAVIDSFRQLDEKAPDLLKALREAVFRAERKIKEMISKVPLLEGMGSTVAAAIIGQSRVLWVSAGDSRIYLIKKKEIFQVSRDHSFLQDLIEAGDISKEEASKHPMAHVLDQCVGCLDDGPDSGEFDVDAGDTIIACTDGLYRSVAASEMIQLASAGQSPSDLADRMIEAARIAETDDDSTVVAAVIS